MATSRIPIFTDIGNERNRQEKLKAEGRFEYTAADDGPTDSERLAMLAEELGEVAQQVLSVELAHDAEASPELLRKELVQLAAIAVAWLERLPRV